MSLSKSMRESAIALLILAVSSVSISAAHADDTCKSRAADKKLAGAALSSFTKKCEKDATASCAQQAADKKIYGAAKTSFTKKCVHDSVGD